MPKVLTYTKGAIIFFEDDKDERIFILQSGDVVLMRNDLDTGVRLNERLKVGEFFGVKNTLAHKPRAETASVLSDAKVIQLTQAEFEQIVGGNEEVILKMLRVFSKDLRSIHHKIETVLKNTVALTPIKGMASVAQAFYDDGTFNSCVQVLEKLFKTFPGALNSKNLKKLYNDAKLQRDRQKKRQDDKPEQIKTSGALAQFNLPMFERFSKTYNDGDVIICEYEFGETFYLIQAGTVQLVKCANGTMKNLDILNPGEFFGEMAILDNSPRSATCTARGTVKCLEFNKENFKMLVTGNPQIALLLLKIFCKRIFDQKRRFSILTITELQARVADVFLMYDEMTPSILNEGTSKRKLPLTMGDVAHWAGISQDEAREELNKLSTRNKLSIMDGYMVINNIGDMKRIVDSYVSRHEKKVNFEKSLSGVS